MKKRYYNPKLQKNMGKLVKEVDNISFPSPKAEFQDLMLSCLKDTYKDIRLHDDSSSGSRLDILPELYTNNFDDEQIWSQIETCQESVLKNIRQQFKALTSKNKDDEDDEDSFSLMKPRVKLMYQEKPDSDDEVIPPPPLPTIQQSNKDVGNNNVVPPPPPTSSNPLIGKVSESRAEELDFFEGNEGEEDEDDEVKQVSSFLEKMEKDFEEISKLEETTSYDELYNFGLEKELSDDDEEEEEDEDEDDNDNEGEESPPSKMDEQQEEMLKQIEKLEEDRLEEARWQDKGEVTQFDRPKEALLEEENLQFVTQMKLKPVVLEKKTEDLESIILNRVLERNFDDPLPYKSLFQSIVNEDGPKTEELKQVKERRGLGQLLEADYRKQVLEEDDDDVLGDDEEGNKAINTEIVKNISKHMERVMHTLNAMSSYNYIEPTKIVDPEEEEEEKKRTRKEIMKPIRKLTVGETEKTRTDRKRKRRHKKQSFKKKTKRRKT